MLENRQPFNRRVIILAVLTIALIVCFAIYSTSNNNFGSVSLNPTFSPQLTNPQVIQNWLPPSVYKYVVDRIDGFLKTNNVMSSYISIQGAIEINNNGAYVFKIYLLPQNVTHSVGVTVTNSNGLISAGVEIDGQQQGYLTPTQNSTQFSGFDNLISDGLTALQSQELQTAFLKFDSSASNIVINTSSIVLPTINPNNPALTSAYSFSVIIDGKVYDAKLNLTGINEIELLLTDTQTNKQVFDSGPISQN